MAAKKSNAPFEFIVSQLEKDRNVSYADVAAAAKKKGYKIYPIMYGRAQKLLGMTGSKKKSKKKTRKKAGRRKAATTTARRPAGRRPALASSGSLADVIESVRTLEQERDRYRAALESAIATLEDALD